MSKFFVFTVALVAIAGLAWVKHLHQDAMPSSETLIVGLQSGYPPFEFRDAKGNIVGFDLDVAARIANKLGMALVIQDMEFEGEILSLKQGKIDLIISGMNMTSSRLQEIEMVPYHGQAATSLSLIFWKEIPQGIESLEQIAQLPQAVISVATGTIPEAYMSRYPAIKTTSFQGAHASLMDVKYGKSIANLVEPDVALYLQRKHPEIKILDIPLAKDEKILGFGIGIKKGNQALVHQIQSIIQELQESGELKKLETQWFQGDE